MHPYCRKWNFDNARMRGEGEPWSLRLPVEIVHNRIDAGAVAEPFLGQGFGQEWTYLSLIGSEGRAHNAYLAVWLELGLGGLLLFLAAIIQFVRAGFFLYGNPRFQSEGALLLALIFALGLDSLGLSTLYWEKLPTIALSLAVVVVGLCERVDLEIAVKEVRTLAYEPFAQHS